MQKWAHVDTWRDCAGWRRNMWQEGKATLEEVGLRVERGQGYKGERSLLIWGIQIMCI